MTNPDELNALALRCEREEASRYIMRGDMSEMDAEAFIKIAVMRRGLSTHFFIMEHHNG